MYCLNGPEEQKPDKPPLEKKKESGGLVCLATLPRRNSPFLPSSVVFSPLGSSRLFPQSPHRQKNPSKNPGSLRLPRHAAPPPPAFAGEGGAGLRRRGRCGGVAHQRRLRRRRLPLPPPLRAVESGRHGQFGGHSVRPRLGDPGADGRRAAGDQQLAARQAGKVLALLSYLTGATPS